MAHFEWNDAEFGVGNALMDRDHREMIKLVNDLFLAMEQHENKSVLSTLLDSLVAYSVQHFKREEEIMLRIDYAHRAHHEQEHEKLTNEMLELQERFVHGKLMLSLEVSKFLREWVLIHILQEDKQLAAAISAGEREGGDD